MSHDRCGRRRVSCKDLGGKRLDLIYAEKGLGLMVETIAARPGRYLPAAISTPACPPEAHAKWVPRFRNVSAG